MRICKYICMTGVLISEGKISFVDLRAYCLGLPRLIKHFDRAI